jgi:hypothetical protein
MTRPFFIKERVSDFDIFDRHADDAIHQLKARLREGHPVDVQVQLTPYHGPSYAYSHLSVHRTWLHVSRLTPPPNFFSGRTSILSQRVSLIPLHLACPNHLPLLTIPQTPFRKHSAKAKIVSHFARVMACTGLLGNFGWTS